MTTPVNPIRRLPAIIDPQPDARADARPSEDALDLDIPPKPSAGSPESRRNAAEAAYAAQLLGQTGQRRGLRGGQEVLDTARHTYLETEFSGPNDRRPRKGRITRTEI